MAMVTKNYDVLPTRTITRTRQTVTSTAVVSNVTRSHPVDGARPEFRPGKGEKGDPPPRISQLVLTAGGAFQAHLLGYPGL